MGDRRFTQNVIALQDLPYSTTIESEVFEGPPAAGAYIYLNHNGEDQGTPSWALELYGVTALGEEFKVYENTGLASLGAPEIMEVGRNEGKTAAGDITDNDQGSWPASWKIKLVAAAGSGSPTLQDVFCDVIWYY